MTGLGFTPPVRELQAPLAGDVARRGARRSRSVLMILKRAGVLWVPAPTGATTFASRLTPFRRFHGKTSRYPGGPDE